MSNWTDEGINLNLPKQVLLQPKVTRTARGAHSPWPGGSGVGKIAFCRFASRGVNFLLFNITCEQFTLNPQKILEARDFLNILYFRLLAIFT